MKEWWAEWYNKYAVLALSAAVGVGGYNTVCWSKLTASDWGTWFGAVFTALAFCGTIYLATKENRERTNEKWETATIFAAGLLERIVQTQRAIEQVDVCIETAIKQVSVAHDPEQFAQQHLRSFAGKIHQALIEFPDFALDELKGIAVLPHHCSGHLAAAAQRIRVIRNDTDLISRGMMVQDIRATVYLHALRGNLGACKISFGIAETQCRSAITSINADINSSNTAERNFL